jgi:hypothetical protein
MDIVNRLKALDDQEMELIYQLNTITSRRRALLRTLYEFNPAPTPIPNPSPFPFPPPFITDPGPFPSPNHGPSQNHGPSFNPNAPIRLVLPEESGHSFNSNAPIRRVLPEESGFCVDYFAHDGDKTYHHHNGRKEEVKRY